MRKIISRNSEEVEIDLFKLFAAYLSKWWLIVICTLLGALVAFVVTSNFITPQYRASVTVYVNNSKSSENTESITGGNLSASQQLVSTYVNIIKSDSVLEKVIERTHLNFTAEQIKKMMSTSQVSNTEIFNVYILNPDPQTAADIANAIADVAPTIIENIVRGSSTKIIDYAKVPQTMYSPSIRKNIAIGALIGLLLALVFLTVQFLTDVTIRGEEDLAEISTLPVLAQIIDINKIDEIRKKPSNYASVSNYASNEGERK